MRESIIKLFNDKPKHAVSLIKKNKEQWDWVLLNCDPLCTDDRTKIYTAVYKESILCPCNTGNLKKYVSFFKGLSFCGPAGKCAGAKKAVSNRCIEAAKKWDKKEANKKRIKTNIEKYGIENTGQLPTAIETRKKLYENEEWVKELVFMIQNTCLDRYGVKNPLQHKPFLEKQRQTLLNNYGVLIPIQNKEIKEKTKKTNLERYGVEFPLQSDELQKEIRNTFKEKYGTETPLASPEIREKIEKTIKEKYGDQYTSILQVPQMRESILNTFKTKYGVNCPSQLNFSKETLAVLLNKDVFSEKLKSSSVTQLSAELNVSRSLIKNYHDRYELDILPKKGRSGYEDEIELWLVTNNISFIKDDRTICKPLELDFYIPEYKLAIEFNGLYWHSEKAGGKGRNYHKTKFLKCQDQNIQLLTIFEDEWVKKSDIIKRHILHLCGKTEKTIGARKFKIRPIDINDSLVFLEKYHIQGSTNGTFILGGFLNNKLTAVVTLLKVKENIYDINRYATDQNATYPGLFSKFISYIERNFIFIKKLTTFADCRWSVGDVYNKSGFKKVYYLRPEYSYTDYNIRRHKFGFRKNKLKNFFENVDNLTEKTMTELLGLDRIWDCGKIKFEKNLY